jgi:hypothetical protein
MKIYDIKLFQELDKTFKDEINRYAKLVKFQKGESIFLKNELMHYFYIKSW